MDVDLIQYYRNMDEETFLKLIQNVNGLLFLSDDEFRLLFLNVNSSFKMMILDELLLYERVLNLPRNRMRKSILDLVDDDIKNYIFSHHNLFCSDSSFDKVCEYFRGASCEVVSQFLDYDVLKSCIFFHDDVVSLVKKKFLIDYEMEMELVKALSCGNFSPVSLFSIQNIYELFIYLKFHILVRVDDYQNGFIVMNGKEIEYDFLKKIYKKHIISLLDMGNKIRDGEANSVLFVTVIKLYLIFGYDNSKKVLEQFFTYATPSSIKRASLDLICDERRNYRILNQSQYYFYGMESLFEEALLMDDVFYFKEFCGMDDEYCLSFMKRVKKRLVGKSDVAKEEIIKSIILEEVQKREKRYEEGRMIEVKKDYQDISRKKDVSIGDLYSIFSSVSFSYQLTRDGKLLPDKVLSSVLLGNCKRDNDCLLRLVLNREALGLNDELSFIITHFDEIKRIIDKDSYLSLYSVLDIIDVSKVFLYHLKPNELDISLDTLSKIIHFRKFYSEDIHDILMRVMEVHQLRKFKISCAIPFLKGMSHDVFYQVMLPSDERLLACGAVGDSCFKIGGPGEDFFKYCLTSSLGFILYLSYQGVVYVLPCSVNGNMVNINSIDPKIRDESIFKNIIGCLMDFGQDVILNTKLIDIVTITNFNHDIFMKDSGMESISIDGVIPIGTDFYTDYNKKDIIEYVLCKRESFSDIKYFDNDERFFVVRSQPYVFSSFHEEDAERIEILLNQIAYSYIDYMDIDSFNKEEKKKNYQYLSIRDFVCVVGNVDWFVGITKSNEIIECILPYDYRAVVEKEIECQKIDASLFHYSGDLKKKKLWKGFSFSQKRE